MEREEGGKGGGALAAATAISRSREALRRRRQAMTHSLDLLVRSFAAHSDRNSAAAGVRERIPEHGRL